MRGRPADGERVVITVDVGGTTIEGAAVGLGGTLAGEVRRLASPDGADAAEVVHRLAGLLTLLRRSAEAGGRRPVAVGLGMPGPFDYARGVSLMQHKLAAVRGLDLRTPLEAAVELPVYFCNDAVAFALGAWWREHRDAPRLVGVTVGTGLGSGFIVAGRPVGGEEGAPIGGGVWDFPFRDGILEDEVSRRAVEGSYGRHAGALLEVKEIATRARAGDAAATLAFTRLGKALGEGLASAAGAFRPSRVVCGGQIATSFDLFGSHAQAAYARSAGTEVVFCGAVHPHLALLGIARNVAADLDGGDQPLGRRER